MSAARNGRVSVGRPGRLIADNPSLYRELEIAYRRGFSQGAAAGAYAVAGGASASQLEDWRKRVYAWRASFKTKPARVRSEPEWLHITLTGGVK